MKARHIRQSRPMLLALTMAMLMTACAPVFTLATSEHAQNDPDTRPWYCDSTGGGGHGGHTSHHYDGVVKGELSWQDCYLNSIAFDMAVDYVQQWPTAGDAEADGFMRVVPYATGMGTHHRRIDSANIDDVFHAGEPEFLMYDGNGPNAELTGMAWWVESVGGPPEGFAGDNDWWHQHLNVCLTQAGTWIGQGYTPQQCAAVGGEHFPNDNWWMAHAWILPDWELQFDVFQNHHPCLPQGGPITDPGNPCWMEAMHGAGHGG